MLEREDRIYWIDYLRVLACFMVIIVHLPEFNNIATEKFYTYVSRIAVPIFFMMSGYLTLPFNISIRENFKKRISRLFFPFLFWSLFYAIVPYFFDKEYNLNQMLLRIASLPLKLSASHLWYMYGIIGLFLFAPIISPWLEKASRNQVLFYLILWSITLFFPYLSSVFTWLEMNEWYSVFVFYNFKGYLGYFILGFFIKKHMSIVPYINKIIISILCFVFAVLTLFIAVKILHANFTSTRYLTINVAFFAISIFLFVNTLKFKKGIFTTVFLELSSKSFGIYLIHEFVSKYIVLSCFTIQEFVNPNFLRPVYALGIFLVSYFLILLISKLPYSKYITG